MPTADQSRKVVVTGVGVVSPLGLTTDEFWTNLTAGQVGLGPISAFDASGFTSPLGGQVPEFKIAKEVPKHYRKSTKVMARDIELAVMAAKDAFATSGLVSKSSEKSSEDDAPLSFDPARFGCNIGAGLINTDLNELTYAMAAAETGGKIDWAKWGTDGMGNLTPLWLLKYLPNMLASHVTILHGLTGPSNNITCAEASGHLSVGEAMRIIQRGDADLMIAGGAETLVSPMGMMRRQLLGRLTTESDPKSAVKPFADDASGTAVSEGGALLILEDAEHAKARGATIYCELAGFGSAQDPHDPSSPDPEGKSYALAVQAALRDASVSPGEVDAIVPHGLGIREHDQSELNGLCRVFEPPADQSFCPIKAQIGDAGAGCAIDLAAAVMAIHTGTLPPAINTPTSPFDASPEARKTDPSCVLAAAFGMGGQNAAIVLRKV